MTSPSSIDPSRFLHEQLGSASPDLLRSMLTTFMNTLMSAEADAVCRGGRRRVAGGQIPHPEHPHPAGGQVGPATGNQPRAGP